MLGGARVSNRMPRAGTALVLGALLLLALPGLGAGSKAPGSIAAWYTDTSIEGFARAVAAMPDGGFVLAGADAPLVALQDGQPLLLPQDAFVARYASDGERLWSRSLDFGGLDTFNDVVLAPDGAVVAVGDSWDGQVARVAWAVGLAADQSNVWALSYSYPDAVATTFHAAVLDDGQVVALGLASIQDGTTVHLRPFLARLGTDGAVQDVRSFASMDGVVWLDLARVGPGSFAVAGSLGGPLGLGACAGLLQQGLVAWHACAPADADTLFGVAASPFGSVATGYSREGSRAWASTTAWSAAGEPRWTAHHDSSDPATDRRASAVVADGAGQSYVVVVNGTLPTQWANQPAAQQLASLQGGGPLIGLGLLAYDADGRLAWAFEHRDPLHHVVPLAAALDGRGGLLVAGTIADAATLGIHPFVARFADVAAPDGPGLQG